MPIAGDRVVVADAAVGDDAGRAARMGAQGEDVAEGAGAGLAARFDHDDLALADRVERALLRVVAAAVRCEEVLAAGDEAQRLRGADDLRARVHRPHAVDRHVVQAALAQLRRESGDRDAQELLAEFRSTAAAAEQDLRRRTTSRPAPLRSAARPAVRPPRASPRPRRAGCRPPRAASPATRRRMPRPASRSSRAGRSSGRAAGSSTSTSTTSPGTTTDEPAGVPVRITSPGSSVKCCERSATICARGKSRPAVVSSCARAPFTQVRTRSAVGSTARASSRAGPIGVNPSPPLDRTLEPLSFARRS